MLSSVPTRLIVRRSRSLSPCSRVLQTSASGGACQGVRETPAESNRNPIVSTSRVSRRGILTEDPAAASVNPMVQYHHLAPRLAVQPGEPPQLVGGSGQQGAQQHPLLGGERRRSGPGLRWRSRPGRSGLCRRAVCCSRGLLPEERLWWQR